MSDTEAVALPYPIMSSLTSISGGCKVEITTGMQSCCTPVESSDWSRVYIVTQPNGSRVFAKGVPRTRSEAHVTSVLGAICPQHVPRLLHLDLTPENETWQWFLLEDAGTAMNENVTVDAAAKAVFALGRIQRVAAEAPDLARQVPKGEPERFRDIVREITDWAAMDMPEQRAHLRDICSIIESSPKLDREIALCCGKSASWLMGLIPGLERLARELSA